MSGSHFSFTTLRKVMILSKCHYNSSQKIIESDLENKRSLPFDVYVFDAKTLCKEDFVMEPKAAKFLIKHGFDFNKLFQSGLPYNLEERDWITAFSKKDASCITNKEGPSIRLVLLQIIRHKLPIVLHNGFCDLLFLYHHFYQNLPPRCDSFQQDITDLFRGGVFDTKFMSFNAEDLSCSYLNYVFKKCQRNNLINKRCQDERIKFVDISFPDFDAEESSISVGCPVGSKFSKLMKGFQVSLRPTVSICEKFALSGYCPIETECSSSHNVDDVLDAEYFFAHQRNPKRPKVDEVSGESLNSSNEVNSSFGHRAGFDSFITGFCFAYFLLSSEKPDPEGGGRFVCDKGNFVDVNFNVEHVKNRVALVKRTHPFCLMKSNFAKMTTEHMKKADLLFSR